MLIGNNFSPHTRENSTFSLSLAENREFMTLDGTHLHSRFGEVDFHGDFLACVDVRVVSLLECALELLQLSRRECRSYSPLLALLAQHGVVRGVNLVGKTGCKERFKELIFHLIK